MTLKIKSLFLILMVLLITACSRDVQQQNGELQKNETAATYNVSLGMAYLQQGDVERAKLKLMRALKQAPRSPDVYDALAYFHEKTGDITAAKQYYQHAISLAPQEGAYQNNYGTFLCRTKQYAEAEQYFLQAALDSNYLHPAEAYENAALCQLQLGNREKAIHYFRMAVKKDPSRRQSLVQLQRLG